MRLNAKGASPRDKVRRSMAASIVLSRRPAAPKTPSIPAWDMASTSSTDEMPFAMAPATQASFSPCAARNSRSPRLLRRRGIAWPTMARSRSPSRTSVPKRASPPPATVLTPAGASASLASRYTGRRMSAMASRSASSPMRSSDACPDQAPSTAGAVGVVAEGSLDPAVPCRDIRVTGLIYRGSWWLG